MKLPKISLRNPLDALFEPAPQIEADPIEDQERISEWAEDVFGPRTLESTTARFNQEVAELIYLVNTRKIDITGTLPCESAIGEEAADCLIVLYQIAELAGVDLHEKVQEKMKINRKRKWIIDGKGHGQHVKED